MHNLSPLTAVTESNRGDQKPTSPYHHLPATAIPETPAAGPNILETRASCRPLPALAGDHMQADAVRHEAM